MGRQSVRGDNAPNIGTFLRYNLRMKKSILTLTAVMSMAALTVAQSKTTAPEKDIIQPSEVAAKLADSKHEKPFILQVGFESLYRSNHIPGAQFAGPAFNAAGLELLKKALVNVPKDREIVLYCGCCPWDHCPNVRPALQAVRDLGFKNVKAMIIEQNLDVDWIQKGYPIIKLGGGI